MVFKVKSNTASYLSTILQNNGIIFAVTALTGKGFRSFNKTISTIHLGKARYSLTFTRFQINKITL